MAQAWNEAVKTTFGTLGSALLCVALWVGCGGGGASTTSGSGGAGTTGSTSASSAAGGGPCGAGQVDCGGVCANTTNDPAHCGGCDSPCAMGEVCSAGQCAVSCGGGSTQCGQLCVNTTNDPVHCGACDTPCAPGEVCSGGMCGVSCSGGTTQCGAFCVNLTNDPAHCGSCPNACVPGEVCSAGTCATNCAGGTTQCGASCVNLTNDPAHCGSCPNACAPGEVCSNSMCATSCGGGTTQCGPYCVNTTNDAAHCGGCNNACAPGEVCSAGACGLSCSGGTTLCGNACVNTTNDALHCGGCNNACAPGEVCSAGACGLSCSGGTTLCGNSCVNTTNDALHCGGCNNACAPGQVCSGGACALLCAGGTVQCGNSCVNTANDPAHCGSCNNACGPYPSATPACVASMCIAVCNAGSVNCNGSLADGCESTPATDPVNCGFCGNICSTPPNATPVCDASLCEFTCTAPFGDCDGFAGNGCEVNTSSHPAHCGMCGNACPAPANATATCSNSTCGFTCNVGFADCNNMPGDGCEIHTQTNAAHCGMCGNMCGPGQICSAGNCIGSGNIPPLSGTNTVDVVRGSVYNAFFADPTDGKIYWADFFQGSQILQYPDLNSFVTNTNATTITLATAREGTYHAALNGFLYYNAANSNTMLKVSSANGQVVTSAPLTGAGFHNQSHFNWGGYSDIAFYTDTGNLLYVLYAAPGNGNIQLSRLDPNSLAIQQTWTIPRVKTNTGFAFMVNGNVYLGFTYSSPLISAKFNLATSSYDTAYTNSLTPVSPSDYVAHTYWDPGSLRLFEVSYSHHLVYPNVF